jgi:hypothetical protein
MSSKSLLFVKRMFNEKKMKDSNIHTIIYIWTSKLIRR